MIYHEGWPTRQGQVGDVTKDGWCALRVIVGLGNPGANYEETRHNVGFAVLDRLSTIYGGSFQKERHLKGDINKITIGQEPVVLIKPNTYMNLSGESVIATLRWFKVSQSDLLIIHDDVSLPLGRVRLQKAGGAGGQHGVESIIQNLGGANDFNRLKIGVGPDPGGALRASYVLSRFKDSERALWEDVLDLSSQAVSFALAQGIDCAMNKFNGIDLQKSNDENASLKVEKNDV